MIREERKATFTPGKMEDRENAIRKESFWQAARHAVKDAVIFHCRVYKRPYSPEVRKVLDATVFGRICEAANTAPQRIPVVPTYNRAFHDKDQNDLPDRSWWLYRDRVFWTENPLPDADISALIMDRVIKEKRQVDRAKARVATEGYDTKRRQAIPPDVKEAVWRRDGGKCTTCAAAESLEFDHIIPLSMGGANTVRNLQLLCAPCNQSKGGNLH